MSGARLRSGGVVAGGQPIRPGNITISNNVASNGEFGIRGSYIAGGSAIAGNLIQGHSEAGLVVSPGPSHVGENLVTGNTFRENGVGVAVNIDCNPRYPCVIDNRFIQNRFIDNQNAGLEISALRLVRHR